MITKNSLQEASNAAKAHTEKLQNMKQHLQVLVGKRKRLDMEIRQLKKSLVQKQNNFNKDIKIKLEMNRDGSSMFDQLQELNLPYEDLELVKFLEDFYAMSYELETYYEENSWNL